MSDVTPAEKAAEAPPSHREARMAGNLTSVQVAVLRHLSGSRLPGWTSPPIYTARRALEDMHVAGLIDHRLIQQDDWVKITPAGRRALAAKESADG